MKHGSLFSGIGGFDLAAHAMGWENSFHCEWNEFGRTILKYYWPKAKSYEDITKTDFSIWRGRIDILTGGFPCQPYSQAGKRKGKSDDRHLWPDMLRAIQEIKPTWVVGENVRGLVNWSGGLVFDEVQSQMEAEGYEVQPFLLPACAVNAPHRRDRIWFVAHSKIKGGQTREGKETHSKRGRKMGERIAYNGREIWNRVITNGVSRPATDSNSSELQGSQFDGGSGEEGTPEGQGRQSRGSVSSIWEIFPTQPPICGRDDGLPTELDGITLSKWRTESLKGYGNAIVPQVALQIFKAIQEYEADMSI